MIWPLYGIAESGNHWWSTYYKHHLDNLSMQALTFDLCLLISQSSKSGQISIVGMQTDDTLGVANLEFVKQEQSALKTAGFVAKELEFLVANKPLAFNSCIMTLRTNSSILV